MDKFQGRFLWDHHSAQARLAVQVAAHINTVRLVDVCFTVPLEGKRAAAISRRYCTTRPQTG